MRILASSRNSEAWTSLALSTGLFLCLATATGCALPGYSLTEGGTTSDSTTSAGGAGGGTATGGVGGTGGSGGSGGSTSTEPLPDCKDGFSCVTEAPPGWEHIRLIEAPAGPADLLECPDGTKTALLFKDIVTGECTPCTCDWVNETCYGPELKCDFGNNACANGTAMTLKPMDDSCINSNAAMLPTNPNTSSSCKIVADPTVLNPGTCKPGKSELVNTSTFDTAVHVCTLPVKSEPTSCTGACVADGNDTFNGPVCLRTSGDALCPTGTTKMLIYASAVDNRTCEDCGCGVPTTTCSMGSYKVYQNFDCGDGPHNVVNPGECKILGTNFNDGSYSFQPPTITADTTSDCTGGALTGSVDPMGEQTICCPMPPP